MFMDTESAVIRFRDVHGDKYDYSLVVYEGATSPVTVICREHGSYSVRAATHWGTRGTGNGTCPKCIDYKGHLRVIPEQDIINRVRLVLGEQYDYSKTRYEGTAVPIFIVCPKHGEFSGYVHNLTKPNSVGCNGCIADKKIARNSKSVVGRFKKVHGDRYDYSHFEYKGMLTKSIITCPKHGDFKMTPGNHLSDHGCSGCTNNAPSKQENRWIEAVENELGIAPIRAMRLNGTTGAYDAVFNNVVVEYDGSYWHSLDGALAKDTRKTLIALDAGYKVIRIRAFDSGRHGSLPDVPNAINIHTHEKLNDDGLSQIVATIKSLLHIN